MLCQGVAVELYAQAHRRHNPFRSSTPMERHDQVSIDAFMGTGFHPQDFLTLLCRRSGAVHGTPVRGRTPLGC